MSGTLVRFRRVGRNRGTVGSGESGGTEDQSVQESQTEPRIGRFSQVVAMLLSPIVLMHLAPDSRTEKKY